MSPVSSRVVRLWAAAGGALACAGAFMVAPLAVADPDDAIPLCEGIESPVEDNCRTPCPDDAPVTGQGTCAEPGTQDITGGPADQPGTQAPGADPGVPIGTDPNRVIYGPSAP
jgi:hypothetical protein